jgi:hypothetical protein
MADTPCPPNQTNYPKPYNPSTWGIDCFSNRTKLCFNNCFNLVCSSNSCTWYGDACPSNGPFLLEGNAYDCDAFTDSDTEPSTTKPFTVPTQGAIITTDQLIALRNSILEEYNNRRWIIRDYRTSVSDFEVLLGEVIDDPDINTLRDFVGHMVNRDSIFGYDYDPNAAGRITDPSGFTNVGTLPGDKNTGETILNADIRDLMEIVDNLRKACVCNGNCSCFANCTCNWDCKCNY